MISEARVSFLVQQKLNRIARMQSVVSDRYVDVDEVIQSLSEEEWEELIDSAQCVAAQQSKAI